MIRKNSLAIVGLGPRGVHALENFIALFAKKVNDQQLHILLFEETTQLGHGHVYDVHQTASNWVNISERALELAGRQAIILDNTTIPSFPTYHEWTNKDFATIPKSKADHYPPRAKIGKYLKERFQSILVVLKAQKLVTIIKARVENIVFENDSLLLETNTKKTYKVGEVLLTIGHQPTKNDAQIEEWISFTKEKEKVELFTAPYPIEQFLNSKKITPTATIAIRGFGLATIDVIRGIAEKFGDFVIAEEATKLVGYESNVAMSNLFVPFSLDGLPMSPKPLNAVIDQLYQPTSAQIANLERIIGDKATQQNAKNAQFLIDAIAPIAASIFLRLPNKFNGNANSEEAITGLAKAWLQDEAYQHELIIATEKPAVEIMQTLVAMAVATGPVSLDFCIGQVWRHCQPSIYEKLSYNECAPSTFADIIQLDERLKRYAYGPPVESIQQLLALVSAGVLTLKMLENPEIALVEEGWKLELNQTEITANIMIDAVLDSPKILTVNSPLVKNLLSSDLIQAVHDDLGVFTNENGYLRSKNTQQKLPIALLGRLAKGTVIGVDAILECFGERSRNWAEEAVARY